MCPTKYTFDQLGTLIDRVHGIFEHWMLNGNRPKDVGEDLVWRTQLAVHEWLANLIQHADFSNRDPRITLELSPCGESIACVIEDNSQGFDLDGKLLSRQEILDAFPDRGMGLLMLKSCTVNLSYQQIPGDRHRLEFVVTTEPDPWLHIPFE